jgi:hypothetical protein
VRARNRSSSFAGLQLLRCSTASACDRLSDGVAFFACPANLSKPASVYGGVWKLCLIPHECILRLGWNTGDEHRIYVSD